METTTIQSTLRPITILTGNLYESNYFGQTSEEADAYKPIWSAKITEIAKRDGVELTLSDRNGMHTVDIDGFDSCEEGDITDTAEYGWFDKASNEAAG